MARKRARDDTAGSRRLPADQRGYVVSISRRTAFRRLHLLGACRRVPGVDYALYELLGEELPAPEQYHDHCHACWARGRGPEGSEDSSASSSEPSDAQ